MGLELKGSRFRADGQVVILRNSDVSMPAGIGFRLKTCSNNSMLQMLKKAQDFTGLVKWA